MTSYIEAIHQTLVEEMERDPRVILLGEDIGAYGGAFKLTAGLLERFGPARVIDTPVAESAIVGAAVGAALAGLRPVAELQFIDFIANGYNQVVNMAAKLRPRFDQAVPMVLRGPCGGGVGAGPFHSQNPEVPFVHAGLTVVAPATAFDAMGLLRSAIRGEDPVLYLEHKKLYRSVKEELPPGEILVPIGKAALRREGGDLAIITYGAMVHLALEAAAVLEQDGAACAVLDLRTLHPLDRPAILVAAERCGRVLLLHEDGRTAGLAGELAALIAEEAFEYLDAPLARVTAEDGPVPYAAELERAFLPQLEDVLAAARRLLDY